MSRCLCADGVYRAGFASTQTAYEKAVHEVFEALDQVEKLLTGKDYLVGDKLTEADIRLWVTLVRGFIINVFFMLDRWQQIRFDPVYVGHFKCNIRDIRNGYPAIHSYDYL